MSSIKITKHSDVPAALDLAKEEVGKEARRILSAGGDALKAGRIKPAEEAIGYAKRLQHFEAKLQALGEEWLKLQSAIETAAPEVREIVASASGDGPLTTKVRQHKTGYRRMVGTVAPKTNFTVTFPDGEVIAHKQAKIVFAKALEKLGPAKVAALGAIRGGEPLVSRNRGDYRKTPEQIAAMAGGWFVQTHSSTDSKIDDLAKIAKRLGVRLEIRKT